MDLSIVIPVMNEEASVKPLYQAIVQAVDPLNIKYEIILVDDGSTDNTVANATLLSEKDERLKIIKLKRNYGQTIGLYAGFQEAKGKIVVTMDGDLQNDPSDIETMMEKINEGYDTTVKTTFSPEKYLPKLLTGLSVK